MSEKKPNKPPEIKRPTDGKLIPEHRGEGSKVPVFKTPDVRPPKK